MNKRDLKFFKELLNERRVELLREAGRSVDGMSDDKETSRTRPIAPRSSSIETSCCASATESGS